jgi:hypothetical protein
MADTSRYHGISDPASGRPRGRPAGDEDGVGEASTGRDLALIGIPLRVDGDRIITEGYDWIILHGRHPDSYEPLYRAREPQGDVIVDQMPVEGRYRNPVSIDATLYASTKSFILGIEESFRILLR